MDKMHVPNQHDAVTEKKRQALIRQILSYTFVRDFLSAHDLPASFVGDNLVEFSNWVDAIRRCEACQGLPFCRQSFRGHVYHLMMDDGFVEETYRPCRYQKELSNQLNHQKQFRYSHMTESEYLIDLMNIDISQEHSESYLKAYGSVISSLADDHKGIYLCGQAGVGKSYLMKGVINYFAKQGQNVSFVKVPLWAWEIKESLRDDQLRRQFSRALLNSDVVVLDDIGAESISAWFLNEILFPVLDQRMEQRKKTYFTSNYTWDDLKERYGTAEKNGQIAADRVMERIRTLSDMVLLIGKSRRA